MSYALAFTADARYDFALLPIPLQELVLDELDRVASLPAPAGTFVCDIAADTTGVRDYVFIHLALDRPNHALLILGIHHHARRLK
jgi:hypothetical protein